MSGDFGDITRKPAIGRDEAPPRVITERRPNVAPYQGASPGEGVPGTPGSVDDGPTAAQQPWPPAAPASASSGGIPPGLPYPYPYPYPPPERSTSILGSSPPQSAPIAGFSPPGGVSAPGAFAQPAVPLPAPVPVPVPSRPPIPPRPPRPPSTVGSASYFDDSDASDDEFLRAERHAARMQPRNIAPAPATVAAAAAAAATAAAATATAGASGAGSPAVRGGGMQLAAAALAGADPAAAAAAAAAAALQQQSQTILLLQLQQQLAQQQQLQQQLMLSQQGAAQAQAAQTQMLVFLQQQQQAQSSLVSSQQTLLSPAYAPPPPPPVSAAVAPAQQPQSASAPVPVPAAAAAAAAAGPAAPLPPGQTQSAGGDQEDPSFHGGIPAGSARAGVPDLDLDPDLPGSRGQVAVSAKAAGAGAGAQAGGEGDEEAGPDHHELQEAYLRQWSQYGSSPQIQNGSGSGGGLYGSHPARAGSASASAVLLSAGPTGSQPDRDPERVDLAASIPPDAEGPTGLGYRPTPDSGSGSGRGPGPGPASRPPSQELPTGLDPDPGLKEAGSPTGAPGTRPAAAASSSATAAAAATTAGVVATEGSELLGAATGVGMGSSLGTARADNSTHGPPRPPAPLASSGPGPGPAPAPSSNAPLAQASISTLPPAGLSPGMSPALSRLPTQLLGPTASSAAAAANDPAAATAAGVAAALAAAQLQQLQTLQLLQAQAQAQAGPLLAPHQPSLYGSALGSAVGSLQQALPPAPPASGPLLAGPGVPPQLPLSAAAAAGPVAAATGLAAAAGGAEAGKGCAGDPGQGRDEGEGEVPGEGEGEGGAKGTGHREGAAPSADQVAANLENIDALALFEDEDDEDGAGEDDGPAPWYKRPHVLWFLGSVGVGLVLLTVGVLLQNVFETQAADAFRWFYFFSAMPILYYMVSYALKWCFQVIEWWFFRESLLYLVSVQYKAAWLVTMLLLLPWFQAMFRWSWCAPKESQPKRCQEAAYIQATNIVWNALLCLMLFCLANLLKAVLAKLLTTHFYRTAHFKKLRKALEKEYALQVLSKPRRLVMAERAQAAGDGVDAGWWGRSLFYHTGAPSGRRFGAASVRVAAAATAAAGGAASDAGGAGNAGPNGDGGGAAGSGDGGAAAATALGLAAARLTATAIPEDPGAEAEATASASETAGPPPPSQRPSQRQLFTVGADGGSGGDGGVVRPAEVEVRLPAAGSATAAAPAALPPSPPASSDLAAGGSPAPPPTVPPTGRPPPLTPTAPASAAPLAAPPEASAPPAPPAPPPLGFLPSFGHPPAALPAPPPLAPSTEAAFPPPLPLSVPQASPFTTPLPPSSSPPAAAAAAAAAAATATAAAAAAAAAAGAASLPPGPSLTHAPTPPGALFPALSSAGALPGPGPGPGPAPSTASHPPGPTPAPGLGPGLGPVLGPALGPGEGPAGPFSAPSRLPGALEANAGPSPGSGAGPAPTWPGAAGPAPGPAPGPGIGPGVAGPGGLVEAGAAGQGPGGWVTGLVGAVLRRQDSRTSHASRASRGSRGGKRGLPGGGTEPATRVRKAEELALSAEMVQAVPARNPLTAQKELRHMTEAELEKVRTAIVIKTQSALIGKYANTSAEDMDKQVGRVRRFAKALFFNVLPPDAGRDYLIVEDMEPFFEATSGAASSSVAAAAAAASKDVSRDGKGAREGAGKGDGSGKGARQGPPADTRGAAMAAAGGGSGREGGKGQGQAAGSKPPAREAARLQAAKEAARKAFAVFDADANGEVSRSEVRDAVVNIFKERRNMARSLKDTETIVQSLEFGIGAVIHFLFAALYLLIWGVDLLTGFSTFSATVLALTFVFGNSVKNMYESMLFLFVIHPYDVGDCILVGVEMYRVKKISLLYTDMVRSNGERVYMPNTGLVLQNITNWTRSKTRQETCRLVVDIGVAWEVREDMQNALRAYAREHPGEFDGEPSCNFRELADPLKVVLTCSWTYNFAPDEFSRVGPARNGMLFVVQAKAKEHRLMNTTNTSAVERG
ncbi:hypothetical protein HYH03_008986 [Edaphochlamys debaryana]|uniref:EF-hand domain-containing protein n=1 Tax=Edaphochlamys debaryana TaxID=47281 RepID=A0A835Y2D4_9CHLO|nr:hypothetical protein HYH03_008986 [Edaphochlamys debaryana]|eukprot:KAG2492831.1 hypothetical protein HYH03_008986 [Edaphochlamys debaryana]